jgi:LPXTG-motif cell wall-anchored protein
VPSVCRRIVVLLAVACLGVGTGPVATALAQGAGDQQYQDPFGDSGNSDNNSSSGSGGSNSGGSGSSGGGGDVEPLTPAPQTSGGGSSSGGSGTASPSPSGTAGTSSSSATTTTAPAATLPNTGLDTRLLLIGGAVLLLLGVGLRLRNAPERF